MTLTLSLVNQWLNFACSRSHAFRHGRNQDKCSGFHKNPTHDFLRTKEVYVVTYSQTTRATSIYILELTPIA